MGRDYHFQGHTFATEQELTEARKEAEAIAYLRARTDFQNTATLLKLYNKLLDRKMMETAVGLDFLKEIRTAIETSGMISPEQLRPLPELGKKKASAARKRKTESEGELEKYKRQAALLKITVCFLSAMVVGMFVIALLGKRSPLAIRYEEEVLNRYGAWSDELTRREERLKDVLAELERQGVYVQEELTEDTISP